MKKRLLAMIMAVVMAMSLLPVSAFATNEANDPGAVFNKTVTQGEDGNVTITLEAWATGETITTTTTKPLDIVLVLDQSGSMAYNFNGQSTSIDSERRQYAMKEAVNAFIGQVAENYDANNSAHRVSVVTFGSKASTLQGWTAVNESGKSTLQTAISGLPTSPSGATNVAAGMTQAKTLLDDAANGHEKIVIVFTDGVPTTKSDFSTSVATGAIATAKALKDANTTVYAIGIFNGVDASQLYGEKWDYTIIDSDITCTGEVGSYWGGSWLSGLVGRNDFDGIDIAAGNRFLNYLSSNFTGTTEIGIDRGTYDPGNTYVGSGTGYKITNNFDRSSSEYYLTASDSTSLNNVFTEISESISTANQAINESAVVKDAVTNYFALPANTFDIKVYTQDYLGSDKWGERVEFEAADVVIDDKTVTVTNYDYAENYVTQTAKEDGSFGQKLVIEFTVTPVVSEIDKATTFPVPTNETGAGIYVDDTPVVTDEPGEAHFCGVKYDANGGVGTVPPSQVNVNGTNFDIPTSVDGLTKEKAVLLGFSATKTDLVTTQEDETEANIVETYSPTDDTIKTLYAVWAEDTNDNDIPDYKETKYSIKYEKGTEDTVTDMPENVSNLLSGTQQTVSSAVPSRIGYTFAGWETSDVTVTDGKFTMPGEDVTFTAQWESSTLTITFNANGGKWNKDVDGYKMNDDDTMASKGYQPSDIVAKIASDPEQTGKVFNGWYLMIPGEAEGETEKYPITVWNDYTPNAQSIAKYGGVVYADWVDASAATLTYTTRQHYIDVEGKQVAQVNEVDQTAVENTAISSLISSLDQNQTYYGQNYVYVANETTVDNDIYSADMKLTKSGTIIDLYYYLDEWNDEEDKTTGGDEIPDKYQAVVIYKVAGGTWDSTDDADRTYVFTLKEKDAETGEWENVTPAPTLDGTIPNEENAKPDATHTTPAYWTPTPRATDVVKSGTTIYTYTFTTANKLTFTFDANGGSWKNDVSGYTMNEGKTTASIEANMGNKIIQIATEPKREGHEFAGWYSKNAESNLTAKWWGVEGFTYNIYEDDTVYAKWEEVPQEPTPADKTGKLYVNLQDENGTWLGGTNEAVSVTSDYTVSFTAGENVNYKAPKDITTASGDRYIYDCVVNYSAPLTGTLQKDGENIVVCLQYTKDNWNDEKEELTGGDGIPDKYQAVIKYVSNNTTYGTVTPELQVETIMKDGQPAKEGTISIGSDAKTTDLSRVYFSNWTYDGKEYAKEAKLTKDDFEVKGGETYTFTANFGRSSKPSSGNNNNKPTLNKEDHYAYIVGYPDGTVKPQGNITRAEVATIFFRMLTDDSRNEFWSQTNSYSDVSEGQWFNNAISTLANAGILSGYPDGTFRPNAPITRAEFTKIAASFFERVEYTIDNPFNDVDDDDWFYKFVMAAYEGGLITGYPEGDFRPNANISRAESVTIVNRTLERAPDADHFLKDMIVWPDNAENAWYYEAVQEATNSHEYVVKGTGTNKYEEWTKILEVRDWPALEKEWSNANSATGGEVVK